MSVGMPTLVRRLLLLALLASLLAAVVPAGASAQDPEDEDVPAETWEEPDDSVGGWPPADPSDPDDAPDETGYEEDAYEEDGDADPGSPDEPEVVTPPLVRTPTVAGRVAMLRTNGKAAIPRGAPARVRAVIAAANRIVGKPYKYGGGHRRLEDRGYDCSGTVGYALIRARLLAAPMVSGSFARWGAAGAGRWITVYANRGHVYMEVAGLRLDTSVAGDSGSGKGPRWRAVTGRRAGFKVRHPAGL